MSDAKICCPCDELIHPPKPDIPAGLASLPRQLAGFPEYRRALLRDIPLHAPLFDWRARQGDDRGVMLLEMWAYVLDVLGFYDERIADETYLRTANLTPSLRRLVELIGYRPRPALAATAVLAAIAEGPQPLVLPAGTGFRSGAFGDEPPQVFESSLDTVIEPRRNRWTLAAVRETTIGRYVLLEPGRARVAEDQLVLLESGSPGIAGRVTAKRRVKTLDGAAYVRLDVQWQSAVDPSTPALGKRLLAASQSAAVRSLTSDSSPTLVLQSLHPQLVAASPVVLHRDQELQANRVASAKPIAVESMPSGPPIPASEIVLSNDLPADWDAAGLTVHFHMTDGGRITRSAKTHLGRDDIDGSRLEPPVEAPENGTPDEFLLHDAEEHGARVAGSIAFDPGDGTGLASMTLDDDVAELHRALRTPVDVLGNLIAATRGERVWDEVLGSGNAAEPFQSFKLAKKPLTYLAEASAPDGRLSTLEVRVNDLLWREIPSFFGAGPDDEVFIVRQNDAEASTVTFGDGERGARLPTGVDNVVATYRHGAGAAKPPANSITQLTRPVAGLRRVLNPVAAGGGRDADDPKQIRRNAPASALTLGRAVSLVDFEALAYDFGVVNAHAAWAWDEGCQRAVVKVWFIADGGDIADELRAYLIGHADPNTPLVTCAAIALDSELVLDLEIGTRHDPSTVEREVLEALRAPDSGLLALEQIPIGCPLFRSQIFEQVLAVEGVVSVRRITLDGQAVPIAIAADDGSYHDFLPRLRVGAIAAADVMLVEA